ncbi:MAG: ABC transporter ATP-binding protein [Alphaproteobacteria bacterium]|nr:ABC transporter ATP-binding protein [Alphaproteobacteria bacterium]
MAEVLAFEHVSIAYDSRAGRQNILNDVSFVIGEGEALGLVGESGCGKSTVALAAMHYLPRGMSLTEGRIRVEGRDLARLSADELSRIRGNRIAMVYQDPMSSLNPVMPIGRQLMEVPLLHGETDERAAFRRAVAMLEEVRLPAAEAMMERYPHQLSGGQQQRVVIAMALMAEPALLIMDEPTTGLDVTIEAAILALVRDLRAKFGTAILFISHNLGTVARVCERIGVLYAGRLVETGSIATVFRSPVHPYTRGLLGALPRLSGGHRRGRLRPIDGTIQAADRARLGCAFAPRCSFAARRDCEERPVVMVAIDAAAQHLVRCARIDAVVAGSAVDGPPASATATNDQAPIVLSVRNLSKEYRLTSLFGGDRKGAVRAVTGVDLDARAGETLAIVGESGCGKSTLARIISGLLTATSGEVTLDGVDLAGISVDDRPPDTRRRIQMVFQNPDSTLNPSHSIAYALTRPLRLLRDLASGEAKAEVLRLLAQVRLPSEMADRMPHQLSGGQRQRVAIARALAGNPGVVVADEPVSALDVSVQAAILNLLGELLEQSQLGLVLISHDLALVRHMADWVAVMYLGRVVEYGPADQVFSPPYHPYTQALLLAAPTPDPDAPPVVVLEGSMPSPTDTILGCPFASRCPERIAGLCDTTPPPIRRFGEHRISCHLEIDAERAQPPAEAGGRTGMRSSSA